MTISQAEAVKAIKTFLESTPLYTSLRVELDQGVRSAGELIPDVIQRACSNDACKGLESTTWAKVPVAASTYVQFKCVHCGTNEVRIWYVVEHKKTETRLESASLTNSGFGGTNVNYVVEFEVQKVGQWPPWTPAVSRRLEKNLGGNLDLFRRAVACIRQGWGIGACAYMRRVTEEETDHILDLVERAAKSEGDQETLDNVAAARQGKVASERLRQAAKKLPTSLRPGDVNPLARLFGAFSEGVHDLPEDQAQKLAKELLETFVFLFENLRDRIEEAEAYATKIQATGSPGAECQELSIRMSKLG